MEPWARITALLCIYGIFKEIRPSEPFLTEYLEGPWLNLTTNQVNSEVYPVWTYSYLVCLLIVLLTTDFLRYKPVLVIEGLSYIATWSLLLWAKGLFAMQMMQFVYGIATSTEVAYYTYIYSVVTEDVFQKVTGYARGALLFGRFLSGVISQTLISTKAMDFHSLNYISFTSVILCFLSSLLLPRPPRSIYFQNGDTLDQERIQPTYSCNKIKRIATFMLKELKRCYSDQSLLLWSIWWAFATCGNIQVGNYIQPLWETVSPTWNNATRGNEAIYNGAIEASHTLLSFIAVVSLGLIRVHWSRIGELLLAVLTTIESLTLIIMAWTNKIWIAYITYIIFRVTYQMAITVVSFNVAKNLTPDTYGLIFGANTFIAILLQTFMTLAFVDKLGLHLDPRQQFNTYGIYFGILAMVFLIFTIIKWFNICRQDVSDETENHILEEEEAAAEAEEKSKPD